MATPTHLDAVGAAADALDAGFVDQVNTRTSATVASWVAGDNTLAVLADETVDYNERNAAAAAAAVTAAAQQATKDARVVTVTGQIAQLQAQIAEGGSATADDVAERDEVVALAATVAVTIP